MVLNSPPPPLRPPRFIPLHSPTDNAKRRDAEGAEKDAEPSKGGDSSSSLRCSMFEVEYSMFSLLLVLEPPDIFIVEEKENGKT